MRREYNCYFPQYPAFISELTNSFLLMVGLVSASQNTVAFVSVNYSVILFHL